MMYFDSAATSLLKPGCVVDAVAAAMRHVGSAGRGGHDASLAASRLVYQTREQLSELFGVSAPERVCFMSNATEALNTAICGMLSPGDHVITTAAEHNSVLRPLYRAQESGVELTIVPLSPDTGRVDEQAIVAAVKGNTRAIVCAHASNVAGNVVNIEKIGQFCKKHAILFVVDAAQSAGVLPIDMERMGISALCVTGHKSLLGPQGTGALCLAEHVRLRPLKVGGSGVHSFDRHHPSELPTALEAGTLNVHGIAGLHAALNFLKTTGMEQLAARECALARLFYRGVRTIPGITLYGDFSDFERRTALVTLNLADWDAAMLSDELNMQYGICTRAGAHCAPLVHEAFGTQGAVRLSFSPFNTEQEVDAAVTALLELAEE